MIATELLKKDHKEAMSMIEQLQSAGEGTANDRSQTDLFSKLKEALQMHEQLEEKLLYPALAEFDETSGQVKDSYEEHEEMDEYLTKLTGLTPSDNEFQENLEDLKGVIKHHVKEEENELFPKAEQLLGKDRLQEMGSQMEEMKTGQSATATKRM